MEKIVDLAIIGGGINGCACAADAALRGLSVVLFEKDDLASKTSSNSSKLIHGGLRYLEHLDFSLVKEALQERERLLTLAPHLIHPLPFVLPVGKNTRNAWMISAGLHLYDYLSHTRQLPRHQKIKRTIHEDYFEPLQNEYKKGYVYFDCQTNDARLVVSNALQAQQYGAKIHTYTEVIAIKAENKQWKITTKQQGHIKKIVARTLINASGAFVHHINQLGSIEEPYSTTLVQGSHLIVNKLYEGHHAYVLQHTDKRIIFTLPYQDNFTLIGTTDRLFTADPNSVHIQAEEIDYLKDITHTYFKNTLAPTSLINTISGVRTLISADKDPSRLSRDYVFHLTTSPAPVVTIYSGKITTYRSLAEKVIDTFNPFFKDLSPSKTTTTPLIGAVYEQMNFEAYQTYFKEKYAWLTPGLQRHFLSNYGALTEKILNRCITMSDLGIHFGGSLYQAEVDYLMQHEWAQTIEDILYRRTLSGLKCTAEEKQKLQNYLRR